MAESIDGFMPHIVSFQMAQYNLGREETWNLFISILIRQTLYVLWLLMLQLAVKMFLA